MNFNETQAKYPREYRCNRFSIHNRIHSTQMVMQCGYPMFHVKINLQSLVRNSKRKRVLSVSELCVQLEECVLFARISHNFVSIFFCVHSVYEISIYICLLSAYVECAFFSWFRAKNRKHNLKSYSLYTTFFESHHKSLT